MGIESTQCPQQGFKISLLENKQRRYLAGILLCKTLRNFGEHTTQIDFFLHFSRKWFNKTQGEIPSEKKSELGCSIYTLCLFLHEASSQVKDKNSRSLSFCNCSCLSSLEGFFANVTLRTTLDQCSRQKQH